MTDWPAYLKPGTTGGYAWHRMLVAIARCGPMPDPVAKRYYGLSRGHLDALVQAGRLMPPRYLDLTSRMRMAFRVGGPLPPTVRCYAASLRILRRLETMGDIEAYMPVTGQRPTEHHLRLLAAYLHAPREVRASWLGEREVLRRWLAAGGGRKKMPRLPDAAFREDGRWIALEVHNEDRGTPMRHPAIAAKCRDILGDAYRGWWHEFRVLTLRGQVVRYHRDGSHSVEDPHPGPGRPPDGVLPYYRWSGIIPGRELGPRADLSPDDQALMDGLGLAPQEEG